MASNDDTTAASSMEEESCSEEETGGSHRENVPHEHSVQTVQDTPMNVDEKDSEDEDDPDEDSKHFRATVTGRGITLSMLMADGLIQAAKECLTIEYLGNKFVADLLEDGTIHEGDQVYNSPSAWAIHCKKIVNPEKKSGCGWASVKYKGRKLDSFKSSWFRRHQTARLSESNSASPAHSMEGNAAMETKDHETEGKNDSELKKAAVETSSSQDGPLNLCMTTPPKMPTLTKKSVKYGSLGRKTGSHDPSTQVECTSFSSIGRIQPFTITLSSNSLLLMDFHSHLTTSEVVGYLGGKWDYNSQQMTIVQAYPAKCRTEDVNRAARVEAEIRQSMEAEGLVLVGWYHSHPYSTPDPSLRDIELQMENQLRLRGMANTYLPCVAMILSPYDLDNTDPAVATQIYWVMPPSETKPHDYGIPMCMSYDVAHDYYISQDLLSQVKGLMDFYRGAPDLVSFIGIWQAKSTYMDKLKTSLAKNFPKHQNNQPFLEFVHNLLING